MDAIRFDEIRAGEFGQRAEPAFVGREAALETLRALWRGALEGRGGLALVEGPPGIGKTRLSEVFAGEASHGGGLVLVGRSREGEGVPAFWLWAQVLRRLAVDEGGREALAELAGAPAELAALVSGPPAPASAAPPGPAPEQSRFLLYEAVTRALARAARQRPLLLVLEDLQWAGSPSLRLLEHLVFEIGELPIVAIATVREEPRAAESPIERLLPRLRQQPRCERIVLRGFSRREVVALLERAIGRPPPPDLSSEICARTEGVPLFVHEAVRLLAERGELRHPERVRRWGVTLPSRALDLIRRPLERLGPACAAVIGAAAVLGREFQGSLAAAVADAPRDAALDLLDEAARAGVIEAGESPDAWRFSHALFQEAALEALGAAPRARLHLRAAGEIERRHRDDPDAVVAELAHHHHAALAIGDPERAFACAQRGAPERALPIAREAIAEARAAGDAAARQEALYSLVFLLAGPDHLAERDALAREAEAVARAGGTADPTVITLLDLACDRVVQGDAEGARRWRTAAGEVAGRDPHLGRAFNLRVYDTGVAVLEGRFADAQRGIEEFARIGRRIEHPYARGVERVVQAFVLRELGDDAGLLRIFDPTRPIRLGPVQFVQTVVARALLAVGRREEAAAVFEDVIGAGAARIPRNIRWYGVLAEASLLAAELGDEDRAGELRELLEPVAEQHAVLPLVSYSGPLARCLARLEETLGRLDRACARFEEAAETAGALGARPMLAHVQVEHGRCLARRGQRAEARERLAEGRRLAETLGMERLAREAAEAS